MRTGKLFLILMLALVAGASFSGARADQPNSQAERAQLQLQQQLTQIEQEIAAAEADLSATKTQKNILANKVAQLKKQQASLQLQIKATNLKIQQLDDQLAETENGITDRVNRIKIQREQVASFMRALQQYNDLPIWYRVVAGNSIMDLFREVYDYSRLVSELGRSLSELNESKTQLQKDQEKLAEAQDSAQSLLNIKNLQAQKLTGTVVEQNQLLTTTRGQEKLYQNLIGGKKAAAKEIRGRIYQLLDVSTQITFGQAADLAKWVSAQTGVRPALVLAVLTQESNLGRNVGTCNRLGDPATKSYLAVMKPDRDLEPFLAITKELGMDPTVTPVSCPMRNKSGARVGWGGAMGPAQFIPSTWQAHKAEVSAITGKSPANPWDIRDAFLASALLLKANGAAGGTRQAEWTAAMRYFSGGVNPKFSFYGDNVLDLADKYQSDLDQLK